MAASGPLGAMVAIAAAPFVAVACGGGALPASSPSVAASAPSPTTSEAIASASASAPLPSATARVQALAPDASAAWIKLLPSRPAKAIIDSTVWATVPTKDDVRIGAYRVLEIKAGVASLLDVLRVRWDGVPGALLLPVTDLQRLKAGDVVTYGDWRGYVGVALVTRMLPKPRVRFRDAYGIVRDEDANVAELLDGTIKPLAWIRYPKDGDPSVALRGLVFAVDGDTLFVRGDDSRAVVVARSTARTVPFPSKKLAVGDAVEAYTPQGGYKSGIVDRVFLPGLSYGVVVDGVSGIYFFSDLALPDAAPSAQGDSAGK